MSEIVKTLLKDVGIDFDTSVVITDIHEEKVEKERIATKKRAKQKLRRKKLAEKTKFNKSIKDTFKKSEEKIPQNDIPGDIDRSKTSKLLKEVGIDFPDGKTISEKIEKFKEVVKEEIVKVEILADEKIEKVEEIDKIPFPEVKCYSGLAKEKSEKEEAKYSYTVKKEILDTSSLDDVIDVFDGNYVVSRPDFSNEDMVSTATEKITYQKSKESLIEISPLHQELDLFKKHIMEQVFRNTSAAVGNLSGAGSGEVRLEFLDDIDTSGRGHKSILMYNDATGKYEVADPDLDAGISNEDDSGDEIILNATTSGGADESGSIQQENNTRMAAVSSVTLTGSTNNTITTITGANAAQGEANLTFDGSTLAVTGAITGTTDLTLGDDLILDSDSAVIQFGDDQEIKLTHVHNTGLSITSTAAAPLVRRGEDVFIVLNQTAAAGTDAGDNVIMDRSASDGTDAGDDIIGEDQVFLHSGMQRDVINIVDSDGTIKKSIAGFSSGTI